jgi:Putative abortive phage resistance protein AbiGi, antitoxin
MHRYTSDELVHFVGRSAVSDDAAFDRLITIINDGWLLSQNARLRDDRDEDATSFELHPGEPLSGNDRYIPEMICFADIPEEALQIHTGKYKRFGLAFRKEFLIPKGARPVYYIPRTAKTQPLAKYDDIAEDWDDLADVFAKEVDPLFGGRTLSEHGSREVGEAPARRIADWVTDDILAFMKFFDPTLPDDDPDNYYMEREWRCVRSISFDMSDIAHVYVADGYRERLTHALPALAQRVRELR